MPILTTPTPPRRMTPPPGFWRRAVLVALIGCLPGVATAQNAPRSDPSDAPPGVRLPVQEVTLDNGMRFLVLERSSSPTVGFVVTYPVGGVNEAPRRVDFDRLQEELVRRYRDDGVDAATLLGGRG